VMASPHGEVLEMVTKLEFKCTNNQAEYEALLAGLEELVGLGARDVEAFVGSNLVVLQVLCHTPF
jgi:ribonuclease HI